MGGLEPDFDSPQSNDGIMLAFVLAATAALSGAPSSAPASEPTPLAAATADLRSIEAAVAARTREDDGFGLSDAPGSPALLEAQWAAARRWVSAWLDEYPSASSKQLEAAAQHATGMQVSMVRLDPRSVLVAANVEALGTAFVLRRSAQGRFLTAMAIDEPGTWNGTGPSLLAAWRSDHASRCSEQHFAPMVGQCGPMAPADVKRLPDEADGTRRFAISGVYVKEAGATDGYQVSVWRWDGRKSEPLLVIPLAQMADEPVIARVGRDKLVIHAKGDFKRLWSCGACSGRQLETTILLPPRGAHLAGTRSLVPELDLIDGLYDRMFRSQPIDGLATGRVVAQLTPIVRDQLQKAKEAKIGEANLGMVIGWRLAKKNGRETLCLSTDNVDFSQVFDIEGVGYSWRISSFSKALADTCGGPGSRS